MDDVAAAGERRATIRLQSQWMALRRAGAMPLFRDFDPRRNPIPWENCFLLDARGADGQPVFDHVGEVLRAGFGCAELMREGGAGPPAFVAALAVRLATVLATGEPAAEDGVVPLASGASLLYRAILLPFADAERAPRYGLGGVTGRVVRAAEPRAEAPSRR